MKIDYDSINDSIQKIAEECVEMEQTRDFNIARDALTHLSILEVFIGVDKFESLPAFVRYMRIASEIVNEHDNAIRKKIGI